MIDATSKAMALPVEEWKRRTKHICKPCWELKHCPYGPLIEEFPLKIKFDNKSCRVYGHDCPVFTCNEPLSEGEELRNISKNIPFEMKLKVIRRDNSQCQECAKPLLYREIHIDHIIPREKGGPTAEHNLRILCINCNLKKGKKYIHQY
jgi:hypothetical protein